MSIREDLLNELMTAESSNEFEKAIAEKSKLLSGLSTDDLTKINLMKKHSQRLCNAVPYRKEIIAEMIERGEVGLQSTIAELYNMFTALEYIFERADENSIE